MQEWSTYKPLLCHPCIKRLNLAYAFKKQCIQSASVMKSYIDLVQQQQKQTEFTCETASTTGGAYMLLPNQKYVKILMSPNAQNANNSFQNVFLNLIPASAVDSNPTDGSVTVNSKDTNENLFLNLNNSLIPIPETSESDLLKPDSELMLNDSKSEDISVEIDPMCFTGLEDCDEDNQEGNDWDDIISSVKIDPNDRRDSGGEKSEEKHIYDSYVPILPKLDDFSKSGQHFLYFSTENPNELSCETCLKAFSSMKQLKEHIKLFHMDNSLTLKDFINGDAVKEEENVAEGNLEEDGEYKCYVCVRNFTSITGLRHHQVRKHGQRNGKKYFIKGMKNARCDICNRAFSTNSYMQLHRKLHMRDSKRYKCKILSSTHFVNNKVDNSGDSEAEDRVIKKKKGSNDESEENECVSDEN